MLEFEKKILLSKNEYDLLRQSLFTSEPKTQVNYYYDTDGYLLNKNGITCRIREVDGKYTTTIKEHRLDWPDLSVENSKTTSDVYDDSSLVEKGLLLQGHLSTRRISLYPFEGIEISLDENAYLGDNDYELEIEYTFDSIKYVESAISYIAKHLNDKNADIAKTDLMKRCNKAGTKSERFFDKKRP